MAKKKVRNVVVENPDVPGDFSIESGTAFGPFASPEVRDADPAPETFDVELENNMTLLEVIDVPSVNVRSKPNKTASVSYVSKKGTKFRAVQVSKEWSRVIGVDADAHPKGYIMSKFLGKIKK